MRVSKWTLACLVFELLILSAEQKPSKQQKRGINLAMHRRKAGGGARPMPAKRQHHQEPKTAKKRGISQGEVYTPAGMGSGYIESFGSGSGMITEYPYNYYEGKDICPNIVRLPETPKPQITKKMTIKEAAGLHTEILELSNEQCVEMGYCDYDQSWCLIINADETIGNAVVEKVWQIIQNEKCVEDHSICDIEEDFDSDECYMDPNMMWPKHEHAQFNSSSTVKKITNTVWKSLKQVGAYCKDIGCSDWQKMCFMDAAFWSVLSDAEFVFIGLADENCVSRGLMVCDVLHGYDDEYEPIEDEDMCPWLDYPSTDVMDVEEWMSPNDMAWNAVVFFEVANEMCWMQSPYYCDDYEQMCFHEKARKKTYSEVQQKLQVPIENCATQEGNEFCKDLLWETIYFNDEQCWEIGVYSSNSDITMSIYYLTPLYEVQSMMQNVIWDIQYCADGFSCDYMQKKCKLYYLFQEAVYAIEMSVEESATWYLEDNKNDYLFDYSDYDHYQDYYSNYDYYNHYDYGHYDYGHYDYGHYDSYNLYWQLQMLNPYMTMGRMAQIVTNYYDMVNNMNYYYMPGSMWK